MANKLLVDLDGCIADWYNGFSSYLNKTYGTTLDTDCEPNEYDFESWGKGVDRLDINEATRKWVNQGGYLKLNIYPGASEFLCELYKLFDIFIVTARSGDVDINERIKQDTLKWLKMNNINTNQVYFDREKVDFCINQGISIMVEDKLPTAIEGAKLGINTILINRAWNQSPARFRIYRSHSYPQALEYLKSLK